MSLDFEALLIDAQDPVALAKWWARLLDRNYDVDDDGDVVLHAQSGEGPDWLFLKVPESKTVKNRLHLDFRPDDQQAEVDRAIELGATRVDIGQGDQSWVVLADPEGNEFCILAADS